MAAPDSLMFSLLNGVLAKFRVPELPSTIGEQLAEVAVVLCSAIRDAVPWLRLPRVQVRLCFCVSLMGLSARARARGHRFRLRLRVCVGVDSTFSFSSLLPSSRVVHVVVVRSQPYCLLFLERCLLMRWRCR
jgi:hypothetical protein